MKSRMFLTVILLATSCCPASGQAATPPERPRLGVQAAHVLSMAELPGSGIRLGQAHQLVGRAFYNDRTLKDLQAFEENRFFVVAAGATGEAGSPLPGNAPPSNRFRSARRCIFLRPSTFVIDDEVELSGSRGPVEWALYSGSHPEKAGRLIRVAEAKGELLCEGLLPRDAAQAPGPAKGVRQDGTYVLSAAASGNPGRVRFLLVLHARPAGDTSEAHSELLLRNGQIELTIRTKERIFRLSLPPVRLGAGEIAISTSDGKALVNHRPLPSGILPHGIEGIRLLEQWDAVYRTHQPPAWDAGRPSAELVKVVENGTIRPGRAVELGSGSGTDAIYLAQRGFDVTGIDIAPTALRLAQEKALKAGVRVRWLLADVLFLPRLEPFDFIFDRGCYHEVRLDNAAAYVEAVRQLSRPGSTRFLLLAGNPNEVPLRYSPPQVAEEDIRSDFSPFFDFEWLRETRFETADHSAQGPLAWSVLLRRNAKP